MNGSGAPKFLLLALLALLGLSTGPTSCGDICVAVGGSAASPLAWSASATWSCGHVPTYADDAQIKNGAWVRCDRGGTCAADNLRVEDATSGLIVRGTLLLAGCNDAHQSAPGAYGKPEQAPCGAWNGATFSVQGDLVYDSSLQGDIVARGVAVPSNPEILRLELSQPLILPPLAGDIFQIRSGPERNHVYQLVAYNNIDGVVSVDLRLYDPQMSYKTDPQTQNALTDMRFLDGGSGDANGALVRVAAKSDPNFESRDLSRCVQLCKTANGDDCTDSSLLREEVSPAGWFLGLGSANPADPSASPGRQLITEVYDDVPAVIAGTTGTWDLVCFAQPLPDSLFEGRSDSLAMPAALWPGFQAGDAWRLFQPASVQYAGGLVEAGDGMLSFFQSCVDADYARFEDFARVYTVDGTPACQRPFQDTVFISWQQGTPGLLTDSASASGCNETMPDIVDYPALTGDRVAIVDTRSPTDTSATCDLNGAAPGGFADGDPLGSTHGVGLIHTRFDESNPPKDWFFRYLGDDAAVLWDIEWPDATYVLDGWTFWYNRRSASTNLVDVAMRDSATNLTIELRNARVTNWSSVGDDWCNPAVDTYPVDGATAVPSTTAVNYDDVLYIDTHRQGMLQQAPDPRSLIHNVAAFGRDTGAIPSGCSVAQAGSIENSWIEGWSYLLRFGRDVVQTRFHPRGITPPLTITNSAPVPWLVTIEDSMLLDLDANDLGLDQPRPGGTVQVRHNRVSWAGASPLTAIGRFLSVLAPNLTSVDGNLIEGPTLLGCENAAWAAANQAAIGANVVLAAGGAILGAPNCPLAAAQQITSLPNGTPPLTLDDPGVLIGATRFGPTAPVGVPASAKVNELGAFTTPLLIVPPVP